MPPAGEGGWLPYVLLVDDEPAVALVVRRMLERRGYRVRVEPSGALGLLAAVTRPPVAAILDINMPGLDGPELARLLREHPATRGVPIVGYSGEPPELLARTTRLEWFDAMVDKALAGTELPAALARLGVEPGER